MIRWKYALPRLLLLGVIVALLWLGLNPLVRWAVVSTGRSATSAKVEIGGVETSLLRTQLRLTDVRVANPKAPMENLVEADQITLKLDRDSLLRRKLVVREGKVSGLRFGSGRETSGTLDPAACWGLQLPHVDLPQLDQQWLDQLADVLGQQLVEQAEKLESVRLAKELVERWPAEYDRLEARANSLKWRVDNLRQLSRTDRENALEALNVYQQAASELQGIQREITELRAEIDRLREQVRVDRDAIVRAKEQDLQHIRETVRLENLSPQSLSEYLLGPELSETIVTLAKWVEWGRRYLPAKADAAQPVRGRGVDVLFPGIQQRPDFLIQSLVLDGQAQLGRHRFQFQGTAADITSHPKLHGKPVVLRARVDAETALEVEAVLDHTGETPRHRITVNCPGIEQPERVLGRPGELAVLVSAGSTHLWATLDLERDAISGQVLLKQEPVKLVPQLADAYGGRRLARSLEEAVSQVREIRVVVDLSGTLQEPDWKLRSNLGPQLAVAIDGMFERELESRRQQLVAYLHGRVEGRLAQFERTMLTRQRELFSKLDLDGTQIQDLSQVLARRLQLPDNVLGQGLPKGLPLRF